MGDTDGKKRSTLQKILSRALLVASSLLTPIGLKITRNDAGKRRLALDFNHLRAAIFTGVYIVIQPLSIYLFPTLSGTLKKDGIDPAAAKNITEVSPNDIRVIPDNFGGNLYELFSIPPVLNPVMAYQNARLMFSPSARAFTSANTGILPGLISPRMQRIYLKSGTDAFHENSNARTTDAALRMSGGMFTYDPPLDGDLYKTFVLLHETRHSSADNRTLTPGLHEADADYAAMMELAEMTGDADLPQKVIDDRTLSNGAGKTGGDYNDALYLYCRFNKLAVPNEQELTAANREAQPALQTAMDFTVARISGKDTGSLQQAFNDAVAPLSPLAQLRVQLYIDAAARRYVFNLK